MAQDTRPCARCKVAPRNSAHRSYCVDCHRLNGREQRLRQQQAEPSSPATRRCSRCKVDKPVDAWSPSAFNDRARGRRCRACCTEHARTRNGYRARPVYDIPDGSRRCSRCKTVKPDIEFSPSVRKHYPTKVGGYCSTCASARHRERYGSVRTYEARACVGCGTVFQPQHHDAAGDAAQFCSRGCKERKWRDSGRQRNAYLLNKYGITHDDYEYMLAEQRGGCALCGVKPEELTAGRYRKYLHVDHDHVTGEVRGLLCPNHNLMLGRFGDNVEEFRVVVAYLERGAAATLPTEMTLAPTA